MERHLSPDELAAAICALDPSIADDTNWGERALFYNPERKRKKGIYIATFKLRDGDNDSASQLGDGSERYRFNIGLDPADYVARFGARPPRPAAGDVVATGHDFSIPGEIMPHPVYAWMGWVAVINPPKSMLADLVMMAQAALLQAHRKWKA